MDTRRILIALTIVLLAAIAPLAGRISPALAATVTVSSCDQAGLSAAISAAGDGGTVTFGSDCSLSVTSTIGVSTTLTIDGGSHAVTLDGGNAVQLFSVTGAGNLTLTHLTLTHGSALSGGAILNEGGTVTVQNSTITGNSAQFSGAIDNESGHLTLQNTTVSGNSETGVGGNQTGSGVLNVIGTVDIQNSTLSGNNFTALFNFNTMTVENSTISDSSWAIINEGAMTVQRTAIEGCSRCFSTHYAITNFIAILTVQDSTISGAFSGGVRNVGGSTLTLQNSAISDATSGADGPPAVGGGLDNEGSTATVQNSIISGNAAGGGVGDNLGGGIYNSGPGVPFSRCLTFEILLALCSVYYDSTGSSPATGTLTIQNSTIAGNCAYGDNGTTRGGSAIYNDTGGTATVQNSTVTGNYGCYSPVDSVHNVAAASLTLANTIVASNPGGNCGGTITDGGNNLSYGDTTCGFTTAKGDVAGQDPLLGSLADNGGPTQTMALGTGSPAIGAGNATVCQAAGINNLDQRGDPRHADTRGACDIGAYDTGTNPPATQRITFNPLPNRTYGDASFDVSGFASASSGLPVSFTSSTPSVCTSSGSTGSTITLLAAGTCTISAAQAGNANYSPAPAVQQSFSVAKAALTITAHDKTMAYGGTVPGFDAGEAGFVNGDTSSVVSGLACTAADSSGAPISSTTPPGSYPITCSGATAANYTISYQPRTLTIRKGMLVVTADNQQLTYGAGSLPAFTASESGFVNGDTSSVLSGSLSCVARNAAGTVIAASAPAGTDAIDCSGSSLSASNYSIAYNPGTLTVNKAPLQVTANNKSMSYGGTIPALDAAFSGFVNGDTGSVLSGAPACSSAKSASSPAGSYLNTITCTAGTLSAPNYTFSFVPGTLTITPAPLTITADNQSKGYGAALPSFTAHYGGLVNGDTPSVVSGLTFSTPATASSPVGSYPLTPSGATASNYTISYVAGTLTVTPAALTITADTQHMLLHGTVPPLTTHLSGLVNGDTAASLVPGPSCLTTGSSSSAVGTYPITCSGAVDANYTISYAPGTLTVTYKWSGFSQPINDPAAGSTAMSVFKAGSTISVKFQLKDANGAIVQAGSLPTFSVTPPQPCSDGAVDETASTVSGDTGSSYRWDSSGQQYIYNDKTTSALSGYCQFIQATLDDGTTQKVYVGYK